MSEPSPPYSMTRMQLLLYPFVAAAVAINLFMLFLMVNFFSGPALSPYAALLWAIPLAIPLNWLAAKWVLHLIDVAEGRKKG